ncbi:MAG: metal-dependent transcriptional regulator [Thermoplasmata archaeon]|nr:metal-dependent transcriptional regulator [Thermoplasmata archaeon]
MKQRTVEEYMECIYQLGGADGQVRTKDIAGCMKIAPASVTEMLQKLEKKNYVNYERYRGASLTKKGLKIAKELERRHGALRDFLVALGLDKSTADKDACNIEHVVTSDTVQLLVKFVTFLKHCDEKPFWLDLFHKYLKTGKIERCPEELQKICKKYRGD